MNWTNDITVVEIVFAVMVFGNIVSGLDDLAIDLYYWMTLFWRRLRYPRFRYPRLTDEDLDSVAQKKAAIFIAAWHEEDVIKEMLVTNSELIDYQNYDFFVACYPNDKPTQERIDEACRLLPNVHKAVNPKPGPSNKADNLNAAFAKLREQERKTGQRYDLIVMHDPEDVLHPLELKLCNYLMTRRRVNMIQTPVFPIEAPPRNFTEGSYMDEFAETHTKDIYVREWAQGFVPSAGVGTAIARDVFDRLTSKFGERVFNTESLTEDYDFSLRLKLSGYKSIFVRQTLQRANKKAGLGELSRDLIATRAHFPATFRTAVRQRTRWMVGINFQSWKQVGWQGRVRTRWMLFHDRKAVWSNAVLFLNYIFTIYGIVYWLYRAYVSPQMDPLLPDRVWIRSAISICLVLMLNRILQRFIASTRIYGIKQGLLSVPRLVWGNIINVTVTFRATKQFLKAEAGGLKIAWDKTEHYFPSGLVADRRGLGDTLVQTDRLTPNHLGTALGAQPSNEWQLETALAELRQLIEADLQKALKEQAAAFAKRNALSSLRARQKYASALAFGDTGVFSEEPSMSDLLLGRNKQNVETIPISIEAEVAYAFGD